MEVFDREELRRLINGDTEAFKRLFGLFYVPLVQHAAFYLIDPDVAEDTVQDVLVQLWSNRHKLRSVDNLEGYLLRAIRNSCLNYLKHKKITNRYRHGHLVREVTEVETDPEAYYKAIYELIGNMPEKRRQVFEMSVFQSKTYAEISDAAGISVNTVKEHIKAAYAYLRKESAHIPYP